MNLDKIDDLYNEHILVHHEEPFHKGLLDSATHCKSLRNPTCGDQVEIQLDLTGDHVQQAWFEGEGCIISLSAASILCEHIEGKSIAELRSMQPQEMLDLLKVPLTPARLQCGLLPFKALKQILYAEEAIAD